MQMYVGTSGYSYQEWKGTFYPEKLAARDMLRFYGKELPAVEINSTFYRMPRANVLETWAAQVPEYFRFALKAPRSITHSGPLLNKKGEIEYLSREAAQLGDRLGAFLFQLPPRLTRETTLLRDFVDLLPPGIKAAFEFRHRSWFHEALYEILQAKGCALCCSEGEDEELNRFVATTDWGYIRLRQPSYSDAALLEWARRIKAQNWREVYVFFKHEESGIGPGLAKQFLRFAANAA